MARSSKLATYDRKRDFTRTPEPAGAAGDGSHGQAPGEVQGLEPGRSGAGGCFVVQRHRARRLHYDLRLEIDGTLASWAVPKGPTLDPKARHLAVHVEDHPMEYADFEGVIPAGEYGGGDVIVWDRGTWSPSDTDDPAQAVRDGELHFDVRGDKLAGRFVLVRTDRGGGARGSRGQGGQGQGSAEPGKEQWLLLHKADDAAVPGWDPEAHPRSVKTGRTNDEVAAEPDSIWRSDLPAAVAEQPTAAPPPPTWEPPTGEELTALDELDRKGRWRVQGHELDLTNLDKVLFPGRDGEEPVTKRELIRYHAAVAPTMLPYLAGRAVNLHRYPDGVDRAGFWHKEVPDHAPGWLQRWCNPDADPDETQVYLVPDSVAALAWTANYGAVELNPWTSRTDRPHEPTWALFDIDPGPATTFEELLVLARLHRTALDHLNVVGRPKVSGQRGIQIWVPIGPGYTFDDTRTWVEAVSRSVGAIVPELVSWAWRTDERGGLARLDYTQNAINKTLVAPYGVRPRPGAPVSVPIEWDELDDPDLAPDRWTIRTVLDRLADVGDPFAPLLTTHQRLPKL